MRLFLFVLFYFSSCLVFFFLLVEIAFQSGKNANNVASSYIHAREYLLSFCRFLFCIRFSSNPKMFDPSKFFDKTDI